MLTVFLKEECLLLDDPIFDSTGLLVYGSVVNGAWDYRCNGVMCFAFHCEEKELLNPVTEWEYSGDQSLVFVPPVVRGNWYEYEGAIEWALRQPAFEGSLQEHLDQAALEAINHKKSKSSSFEDFDDDIAF